MKKMIATLLAGCMVCMLAAGCGGSSGNSGGGGSAASGGGAATGGDAAKSSGAQVVIKFNSVKSSSDKMYEKWAAFCDRITEESKGTVKVEIYPSESLGKTTDMIEAISKGAAVMQDCDTTHLADYVPDMSVFMHPYLIQTPDQIEKLWKSDLGGELTKELEDKGLHVVTIVYFGTRHLISNTEVNTRADTKNLKIRCASTKMWNEVAKVLGGNPTNTTWSETYNALSQGVADAAESPYSLLYSSKLYEPCKNLSLTGHLVAHTAIVMSEDVYQSLPPEGKAAIDKIGSEYPALAMQEVLESEEEFKQLLLDNGVKINEVDKTAFVEAAKDVSKAFPEWSPNLYDRVLEAIS